MLVILRRALIALAGCTFSCLAGAEFLVEITLVDKLDDERGYCPGFL